jgi:hypothetical protein
MARMRARDDMKDVREDLLTRSALLCAPVSRTSFEKHKLSPYNKLLSSPGGIRTGPFSPSD